MCIRDSVGSEMCIRDSLNDALARLRRVARPGSLVFILSDFYAIDEDTRSHLQRLRQHCDVFACQDVDALETEPLVPGRYAVSDGRQRGVLDTRTQARRHACSDYFTEHHHAVAELMQQCAVPLQRIQTTDDVVQSLRAALAGAGGAASQMHGEVA